MISTSIIERHRERLINHYISRGLRNDKSIFYANLKIEKLTVLDSSLCYFKWISALFKNLNVNKKSRIIDIGCGSGELVIVMRLLGFDAYGIDIYLDEISIAKELALDLGIEEDIFILNKSNLLPFNDNEFELSTMFSVMEHLPNYVFQDLTEEATRIAKKGLFSLVPNKFKLVDDHTRVPFLGLFPRWVSLLILKGVNIKYQLSENGEWDVYLRSFNTIENNLSERSLYTKQLSDNLVYPPLNIINKQKLNWKSLSLKTLIVNLYLILVIIFFKSEYKEYPYLNLHIYK